MNDYSADLAVALELADRADSLSLPRFGAADLRVDSKPDLTPVSEADLAVEHALRQILTARRPADTVIGEEFGSGESVPAGEGASREGGRAWVIDPIDGTKNYVRGVPIWATLIALFEGGVPVLGVVSAPALARRWWGARGGGAFSTFAGGPPRPCVVSAVTRVEDSSLSFSEVLEWKRHDRWAQFDALMDRSWRTRGYGDFYSYMLVAEGAADVAAEPELSVWDLAALAPIVIEAGGRFTDIDGGEVSLATVSALATNGLLHDEVVTALK